uniref:Uncharacterized protein n=1 Tax=Arundo donax TaxID=35708 RepID=A0A0A8ZN26_ARUDO
MDHVLYKCLPAQNWKLKQDLAGSLTRLARVYWIPQHSLIVYNDLRPKREKEGPSLCGTIPVILQIAF